jgi:concanavalin A-like lectin/glucanase superfamily protein
MEKLKFKKLSSLLVFITIASLVVVSSCADDPVVVPTDYAALNAKITDAETLIATTEEGLAEGQYPAGSQATLQTAIDLAKSVASSMVTQTAVDNAVIALQAAIDAYNASVIVPIDPTNLVGHWQFNDGTGSAAKDDSGNGFDGTFQTGHANFGGGTASWGTDRYGNANSALVVDQGAWVEVPYNASLNPAQITISLWVNAAEIRESNRFLGLQSWLGYKFQLQSANKSFFTAAVTPAHTGAIYDKDTDPALPINEWIHLAVSFGGGEMVFYIDGTETARHDVSPAADMATITDHNLAIGVGSSRYADTDADYGDTNSPNYHIIPAAWGGYFNGSLDELRIYKTVLSPTQIQSIYDLEKP